MSSKFPKYILVTFFTSMLLACSLFTPKPEPSAAEIEREEQAVYSFFIGGNQGTTLILEHTTTDIGEDDPQKVIDFVRSGIKGISSDTIDSYLNRNAKPTLLSADMELGSSYVLLDENELHDITIHPNWAEALRQKYPGSNGYIMLSHVGFNRSLDQALIYVGYVGGPLMGSGSYYLMEKKNGT